MDTDLQFQLDSNNSHTILTPNPPQPIHTKPQA